MVPYLLATLERCFICIFARYRKAVGNVGDSTTNIIQPEYDSEGRGYVEFLGQRKSSVAKVKVSKPGSGRINIKHVDYMDIDCDISYFHRFLKRYLCYNMKINPIY